MGKFGKTKQVILNKLTDLYSEGNKSGIKKLIKLIKENKEFCEMYVFYDEIEKMHFEDRTLAESYVNNLIGILSEKNKKIETSGFVINEEVTTSNKIYDLLDILSEKVTLTNLKTIAEAKNELINFLLTPKEIDEKPIENFTLNENLLYAVLVNKFNDTYLNELTEEQQVELQEILKMDFNTLTENVNQLKEEILLKVDNLLSESVGDDNELKSAQDKLNDVKSEVQLVTPSKYNYYRLRELKNGLEI